MHVSPECCQLEQKDKRQQVTSCGEGNINWTSEIFPLKMVKDQNRMPRGAVASPSSNLPGQGPRLPNITWRVTYVLGKRMKKEGPKVPSSPDLSVVLWMACFQHSSDEQTGRNVRDSHVLSCHK